MEQSIVNEVRPTNGYAPVNGVDMYWESRGTGGTPLIVTHGGFGLTSMFGDLLDHLAVDRRVIAVELQGHGHTRDIDRPFRFETFGDDLAGLIDRLDLGRADLLGYSLGGGASLRAAIQHPDRVRRLVLVATACRRDDWYPGVLAQMEHVNRSGFDQMKQSPMYSAWSAVAPDVQSFPSLMDKTGDLLMQPYDWAAEVRAMKDIPTLLVYGDADSIPPIRAAEFFALLGGGQQDAGWDGTIPTEMRLAILPGKTHYDIFQAPELRPVIAGFIA